MSKLSKKVKEDVPTVFVKVEFEEDGRRYVYKSPFVLECGQLVIINVYGKLTLAEVVETEFENDWVGPIKSIVGLGYSLEDLVIPTVVELPKQSLFNRVLDAIS